MTTVQHRTTSRSVTGLRPRRWRTLSICAVASLATSLSLVSCGPMADGDRGSSGDATETTPEAPSLTNSAAALRARFDENAVLVGVIPCGDVVRNFERLQPLAAHLSAETSFDVEMHTVKSCDELLSLVKAGEVDFALQGAHTYTLMTPYLDTDYLISAVGPTGEPVRSAAVVVRKDSGISRLEDLRGKVVEFGAERSAHKWLAAKMLFEEHGVSVKEDLAHYGHGECCEDTLLNVYLGAIDAGVVCEHVFEHTEELEDIDLDALFVIDRTPPIPAEVLAPVRGTNPRISEALAAALIQLDHDHPAHDEILRVAGFDGFARAVDSYYDEVRQYAPETCPPLR